MRPSIAAATSLLLLCLAGCVNYDERIEINSDGSGVVRMHLAIVEQVLGAQAGTKVEKEDDLFPVPRKDLVADFEKDGFKVISLRAESVQGLRHYYIVLGFKSVDDLARSSMFGGRRVSFKRVGDKFEVRQEIVVSEKTLTDRVAPAPAPEKKEEPKPAPGKGPKKAEEGPSAIEQLEARFGKERVKQMFSQYSITFSVEMPGCTLIHTNGTDHHDAVAFWETPLSQLLQTKPTIRMEADFAAAPAPAPEAAPTPKAGEKKP